MILKSSEYCVIRDPVGENGKNQFGTRVIRKGPQQFFLQPGEVIEGLSHQNKGIRVNYLFLLIL